MRGGEPRGSARGRDRGIRSATKAGSGAAIVSGAIEDIARRPRGSRREIGRARTRGAPRRRAPPSHNCLTTGALVRKSDGWGGGTAGRAPTTRRTGIRKGRTVRVLVGAPEAFNVVPIPPCASAPRGAPLISPATHAPVTPRRGRKKKHSLDPTNPIARAPAGGGAMRRRSTHLDEPEQRVNIIIGRGGGGLLSLAHGGSRNRLLRGPPALRDRDRGRFALVTGICVLHSRRTRARVPDIRAFADFRRDHDLRQDLMIVRTPSRFPRGSCAARVTVPMQRGRGKNVPPLPLTVAQTPASDGRSVALFGAFTDPSPRWRIRSD